MVCRCVNDRPESPSIPEPALISSIFPGLISTDTKGLLFI